MDDIMLELAYEYCEDPDNMRLEDNLVSEVIGRLRSFEYDLTDEDFNELSDIIGRDCENEEDVDLLVEDLLDFIDSKIRVIGAGYQESMNEGIGPLNPRYAAIAKKCGHIAEQYYVDLESPSLDKDLAAFGAAVKEEFPRVEFNGMDIYSWIDFYSIAEMYI